MAGENLPESLFRAVADQLDMGIVLLDARDTILYWNRFMVSHCRPHMDAVGRNLFDAFPDLPMGLIRRKLALVRTLGAPAFVSWRDRPQPFPLFHGRTFTGGDMLLRHDVTIFHVASEEDRCEHVCIATYDTSEVAAKEWALRKANDQLTALSRTDLLTGLCNRREMERLLRHAEEEARRYGQPFSILLIDVDHFKQVNDTFGHATGDEALRLMGRLLAGRLRAPDMAARFGGEEFLVCLSHARAGEAMQVAERLRAAVEGTQVESPRQSFQITVSVGVAEWSDQFNSYTQLIDKADQALYAAKRDGRNRSVCASGQP